MVSGGAHELHVDVTDEFMPPTEAHAAPRVSSAEELERLATQLEEHGVAVRPDPAEIPGRVRLHLLDPWGNRLELLA